MPLKVPYQSIDGIGVGPRQQLYRNFEEIQRAFRALAPATSDEKSTSFGVARIGTSGAHGPTYAEFSHVNQWTGGPGTATSYCLIQQNNGVTHLNSVGNGLILINNTEVARWDGSNFSIRGNRGLHWLEHGGGFFMQDTTWIRTIASKSIWAGGGTLGCDGKITVGRGGGVDHEKLTIGGSNSGISMWSRNDGRRWAVYPDNRGMNFWEGIDRFLMEDADGMGRFQCGLGHGGAAIIGPWMGHGDYAMVASLQRAGASASHYGMIIGTANVADADVYQSASATNGAIIYRFANNGSTFMSAGINNRTMTSIATIDMAVPALGGNTMVVNAGGSWQVGYVASTGRFKRNVRSLRDTPDPDSGPESPIFKLRPARFNLQQAGRTKDGGWKRDGFANADEINARFPNGVVGLVAEEVEAICPDAVLRTGRRGAEPWDRAKHGLPPTDPETGEFITEVPGYEDEVIGIDNDRLIAYLIDAVQYLKDQVGTVKSELNRRHPA